MLARKRRPPQHALNIPGRLRVIGKTREIGILAATIDKHAKRAALEHDPAVGRNRLFDRQTRQLVAEGDVRRTGAQHA